MSRAQLTSTVEQNSAGAAAPVVGGKNFAANGGFDWWQRGTSFSSAGVYTADRWYYSFGGTVTLSQETSIIPTGATYAAKVLAGASSSFGELYQALESYDVTRLAGQTITISGYVRANSTYTGNAVIAIQTNTTANTQTGGTWTEQANSAYTPSTSTYNRFTLTYAVPAGTAGLRIRLGNSSTQASGAALYWGNVQVEVGSVATPFSRAGATLQGELSLCQRYYYRYTTTNAGYFFTSFGTAYSTTNVFIPFPSPATLRIAPTSVDYSNIRVQDGVTSTNASSVDAYYETTGTTILRATVASGLTQYRPYFLGAQSGVNGYIGLNAEL